MAAMKKKMAFLQKYYVYDPGVTAGDELGGLLVRADEDAGNHVLASPLNMQYWVDQGLVGLEPVGKLSGAGKELLAQITRGRSENPDDSPARVPRYSRSMMGGAPSLAGQPVSARMKQRQKQRQKEREKGDKKPPKKPEPKQPERIMGTPAE